MKRRQKTILARYIRRCADALGLRDWKFALSDDPASDDAYADILAVSGQKRATIRLGVKFWTATPDEQRATIVHELLHCHLAGADGVIADDLKESGKMTVVDCDWLNESYKRQREYAIDGIAEAIAVWLPPLVW